MRQERKQAVRGKTLGVPVEPPTPAEPDKEAASGRVAVWLDPGDVRWLARECAGLEPSTDDDRERVGRVRFRLLTALHKAGLPNDPWA